VKLLITIEHTPKGIIFCDQDEYKISAEYVDVKLYDLKGRALYVHLWQSPYEFMSRLIETAHILFSRYPAYTVQEEIRMNWPEKKAMPVYCVYCWGVETEKDNPALERIRLEQEAIDLKIKLEAEARTEGIKARSKIVTLPGILKPANQIRKAAKKERRIRFLGNLDQNTKNNEGYEEEKQQEIADQKLHEEACLPSVSRSNISRMKTNINLF
jgi:hypothetical protein